MLLSHRLLHVILAEKDLALPTGDDIEHPEELPSEDQVERADGGYRGEKVEDASAAKTTPIYGMHCEKQTPALL